MSYILCAALRNGVRRTDSPNLVHTDSSTTLCSEMKGSAAARRAVRACTGGVTACTRNLSAHTDQRLALVKHDALTQAIVQHNDTR